MTIELAPPDAPYAEAALLGSILIDPPCIGEVIEKVAIADFTSAKNATIWSTMIWLFNEGRPLLLLSIVERLRELGELENAGGEAYLVDYLPDCTPSSKGVAYYGMLVRTTSLKRRLQGTLEEQRRLADGPEPVEGLIDAAEAALYALRDVRAVEDSQTIADIMQEAYDDLVRREDGHESGISTGFRDLDEQIIGLQPGETVVIAGRPSSGKTALAMNIAENIAERKIPVGIFSVEMSRKSLANRMMIARSGVDAQKVRRNMINPNEYASLNDAKNFFSDCPMWIDDTPSLSLMALRTRARRWKTEHNIAALFIDYLQLMTGHGDSREQEVSSLSRGIKGVARELKIPVVVLSQLNRGPESRDGNKPRLSDLRESGSIEQDADTVLMLYSEDYYHRGEPPEQWTNNNTTDVIIAKQRNGPTGSIKLHFDSASTKFENHTTRENF